MSKLRRLAELAEGSSNEVKPNPLARADHAPPSGGTDLALISPTAIQTYEDTGAFLQLLKTTHAPLYQRLETTGITKNIANLSQAHIQQLYLMTRSLAMDFLVASESMHVADPDSVNSEQSGVMYLVQILFLALCINIEKTESAIALKGFISEQLVKITGPAIQKPPGHTRFLFRKAFGMTKPTDADHFNYLQHSQEQRRNSKALEETMGYLNDESLTRRDKVITALILAHHLMSTQPSFFDVSQRVISEMQPTKMKNADYVHIAIAVITITKALIDYYEEQPNVEAERVMESLVLEEKLHDQLRNLTSYQDCIQQLEIHQQKLIHIFGDISNAQILRNRNLIEVLNHAQQYNIHFMTARTFVARVQDVHMMPGNEINTAQLKFLKEFDQNPIGSFMKFVKKK